MYIYTCIYIHKCIYIHIYIYECIYIHISICICTHMHMCINIMYIYSDSRHMRTGACLHTQTQKHSQPHPFSQSPTNRKIHKHIYKHMHTHKPARVRSHTHITVIQKPCSLARSRAQAGERQEWRRHDSLATCPQRRCMPLPYTC